MLVARWSSTGNGSEATLSLEGRKGATNAPNPGEELVGDRPARRFRGAVRYSPDRRTGCGSARGAVAHRDVRDHRRHRDDHARLPAEGVARNRRPAAGLWTIADDARKADGRRLDPDETDSIAGDRARDP